MNILNGRENNSCIKQIMFETINIHVNIYNADTNQSQYQMDRCQVTVPHQSRVQWVDTDANIHDTLLRRYRFQRNLRHFGKETVVPHASLDRGYAGEEHSERELLNLSGFPPRFFRNMGQFFNRDCQIDNRTTIT